MRKLIFFFLGAPLSYFFKLGLTYYLTSILQIHYMFSYFISLMGLLIITYSYNKYIAFASRRKDIAVFSIYTLLFLLFYVLDYLLVYLLASIFHIHYLVSIIIVSIILFYFKFSSYDRLFV